MHYNSLETAHNLPTPEQLLQNTVVTKLVYEANKKSGVAMSWNPNTWTGYSTKEGLLQIGIQPVPQEVKNQWGITTLSDIETKRYIFSHENMHHVLWAVFEDENEFPEVRKLLNSFFTVRTRTSKGFSRLGNMELYNASNRNTAHEEDLVELMNIYCLNPDNLRKYLDWLVTTDKDILDEQDLFKISSQEVANIIFKQISLTVAKFLKMKGLITTIKED
jgi:hypothetical protein